MERGTTMAKEKMSFEASMERLEQIVRAMERGDVPLEQSLALFQEGTELVKNCQKLLDEARIQVEKVMNGSDDEPVMEEFADE
jgi:exodeoxyribonuclease VII small subunit